VIRRYAVRAAVVPLLTAASLALSGTQVGALAATGDASGPEWGANQARPTFEESPSDGNPVGPGLAAPAPNGAPIRGSARAQAAAAAVTPGWVLHGAGWGHGLGMSQYGAWEMAKAGKTAKQILATYYTGTTYDAVDDTGWVNVNISTGPTAVSATSSALASGGGPFTVTLGGATMTATAATTVSFSISASVVTANCSACTPKTLSGPSAVINWDRAPYPGDRTLMKIAGGQYRDGVAIVTPKTASTLNVVMQVRVHDEYLDYLAESPWSWKTSSGSLAALQAQAAAARGYVLTKRDAGLRDACDCHVYDTTQDQVYGGYTTVISNGNEPYWPNWKAAVRATGSATTGYVPRYAGKYIQAFYSSSSGGRTENNEDVWFELGQATPAPIPYIRGVADPWSLGTSNPNRAWRQVTGGGSMASVFGLADVVRLDLRDRTVNGGVHTATATSSSGAQRTVTGDALRGIAASPGGALKSTMIRHLTGRLSGPDRYASATAVARRVPATATSVVIAGGDTTLSDASVAGPLASTLAGPLLLTQRDKLPAATVAELDRRGSTVKTAFVVGGAGVVSDAVAAQLRSRGITVTRLGGHDRYETSALVAKAIKARRATPTVIVAGGEGLADALGASGPASALKEPIVLTQATRLTPVTAQALKAIGATQSRIVGGTAVVGSAVQAELTSAGVKPIRLAGDNRYESSAAVAKFYRPYLPTASEVVLTSGADTALVDSLVAGTLQRLMVLTQRSVLSEPAARTLQMTAALETVTAVGGTGALTGGVLTAAANS
jgi:SpoIID/LytB domain protein